MPNKKENPFSIADVNAHIIANALADHASVLNSAAALALNPKLLFGQTPGVPLAVTIGSQPPSKLPANFTGLDMKCPRLRPSASSAPPTSAM
jgi:hypothetical protein